MDTSSKAVGNSTLAELEDSIDPSHAVAVVAGDLPSVISKMEITISAGALGKQRQISSYLIPNLYSSSAEFKP